MNNNEIIMNIKAISLNESFARIAAAAFVAQMNPLLSELADIKTAVSEAVTNSIIHGYCNNPDVYVNMILRTMDDNTVYIEISDTGIGIEDIEKAREPLYTSKPELERSGMGFTVMETLMDELSVSSEPGRGTKIIMKKKLTML